MLNDQSINNSRNDEINILEKTPMKIITIDLNTNNLNSGDKPKVFINTK